VLGVKRKEGDKALVMHTKGRRFVLGKVRVNYRE